MDIATALTSFSIAAILLTLTPGLDTALVLRTAAVESGWKAIMAGLGIVIGVLAWGLLAALGLGAVLSVSETTYQILRIVGAAYLFWLGGQMLLSAFRGDHHAQTVANTRQTSSRGWFAKGVLTNLLNPKVGVFYVSFLPQFMVEGVEPIGFSVMLAGIHALMGLVWFATIVLATRPISHVLQKPSVTRALDGITGTVLVGFGLKLFFDQKPA